MKIKKEIEIIIINNCKKLEYLNLDKNFESFLKSRIYHQDLTAPQKTEDMFLATFTQATCFPFSEEP